MRSFTAPIALLSLCALATGGCRFWSVRPIIEEHLRDSAMDAAVDGADGADIPDVPFDHAPDGQDRDAQTDSRVESGDARGSCAIDHGGCGDPTRFECVDGPTVRCLLRCEPDRQEILRGVGRVDTQLFVFSPLVVHGDNACPLLVTPAGRPFAAFAREGLGRVLWFGHDAVLTTLAAQPDTAALLRNALAWGVGRSTLNGVRIGLETGANLGNVATIVVREGATPRSVAARDVRFGDVDAWVTASTRAPTTEPELSNLRAFVQAGGLLLHAGQAWNWARTNPGQPIRSYPGNSLVSSAGIFIVGSTIAAADTAAGATVSPSEFSHARRSLDRVLAHLGGARPLTMSEQLVAAITLADPVTELPLDTPFWSAARALLAPSLPTPTRDRPLVVLAQPVDAARLNALGRVNRDAPEPWIERSAIGEDFPGPVSGMSERVSVSIDARAPVTESRFTFARSGAAVWRSMGVYAAPGARLIVSIPSSATGLGLEIQIGAHDRSILFEPQWERAPSILRAVALDQPRVTTASAFGGLVYVRGPVGGTSSVVEVSIEGATRAPSFSRGQLVDEWRARVLSSGVPWGELVGDRVILTLPLTTLRSITAPDALVDHWDAVLVAMAELAGLDAATLRPERVVLDRQLPGGLIADSGYPTVRLIERAALLTDLATLRREGEWGTYWVLGRRFQSRDWTIPGSADAIPALFSLYALERVSGRTLADPAYAPLAAASRAARIESYVAGGRNYVRDFNGNTALEMYLQLIEGFGWAALRALILEYQSLPEAERPVTDDARIQQWALRSSRVFARDLSPFYTRWGLPIAASTRAATAMFAPWTEAPARP